MTSSVSRNIYINDRRISMRLELELWHALEEIVSREGITFGGLCTLVNEHPRRGSFTSIIRTFAVLYYQEWIRILECTQISDYAATDNLMRRALQGIK